jgi:hydrophobic/amphiphilic exporter-1 (mainly G- bacteria), HAE1 family
MKITEVSIKRPTIVVVVFTILTLLGVMSYKSLNYELLPKFTSPVVTIAIYGEDQKNHIQIVRELVYRYCGIE